MSACPLPGAASLPASRAEARAQEARHYFTGVPCKNGHLEVRAAVSGHCMQCDRDRAKVRLQDPEYRALHRKLTLKSRLAKLQDPAAKERIRRLEKAAAQAPHRKSKQAELDRNRNQRPEVIEARRERDRKRYREKIILLKHDPEFKASARSRTSKWRAANRPTVNAKTAARRAALLKRLPPWVTESDQECMRLMYAVAARVSRETGIRHEIDHCIPLQGSEVCGLHVPANLQLMNSFDNRSKGNKFLEAI